MNSLQIWHPSLVGLVCVSFNFSPQLRASFYLPCFRALRNTLPRFPLFCFVWFEFLLQHSPLSWRNLSYFIYQLLVLVVFWLGFFFSLRISKFPFQFHFSHKLCSLNNNRLHLICKQQ